MKEIDYKEKYEQALAKAKELARDGYLDDIFPEFKEPYDERIRKRIIQALLGDVLDIEETNEAIDWLKRQGEQKHQYISRPKYIGEKELLGEQKPSDWAKEDIQMYRNILFYLSEPSPLKEVNGKSREQLLDWFKALKDRVMLQPQKEWSKWDDQYLLVCKNALAKYQYTDKWDASIISCWLEGKLKSLRWKPSDEQMNALSVAVKHGQTDDPDALKKLLEQLKKLIEE